LWRLRHFSRGGFVLEKILRSAISVVRKRSKILKKQMILSPVRSALADRTQQIINLKN
jgi:hypothetical protein